MRKRRLALRLVPVVVLLTLGSGCQALQPYRPVLVLARDAETHKPIANAVVRVSYPPTGAPSAGAEASSGVTGVDGVAHLRAAPRADAGVVVEAASEGYLYETKSLPPKTAWAIPQGLPLERIDQGHPTVVLEMYTEPRATVELVVPAGYRGLIKADVRVREEVRDANGAPETPWWGLADAKAHAPQHQRLFRYDVGPSGEVEATGPALLLHDPDFRVRYADGTPASWQATDSPLGYWRLKSEGACQYLVVGASSDYEALRNSGPPTAARPSDGGARRGQQADRAPADPVVNGVDR